MSIYKSDECVNCDLPCLGKQCPYKNIIHKECDVCGREEDKVYKYDKSVYCKECLITRLVQDEVIQEAEYEDESYR